MHAGHDAELRLGRSDSSESGCSSTVGLETVLAVFTASTDLFCDTLARPSPADYIFKYPCPAHVYGGIGGSLLEE